MLATLFEIRSGGDNGVEDCPNFSFHVKEIHLASTEQLVLHGILVVFVEGGDAANRTTHGVLLEYFIGMEFHQVFIVDFECFFEIIGEELLDIFFIACGDALFSDE
jgi:hypothetical protein